MGYKCTYFYIAASILDTYLADIFASECKFGKVDCTYHFRQGVLYIYLQNPWKKYMELVC